MAGQDDLWAWLQSLQPNQGAAQPYGPGGVPGPYSGGPEGLMPGGGLMGRQGTTPGAPSMGYPAMGKFNARPQPAQAQSPPFFQFGGFHPENIFQSHPPGSATLGPVFNASGSPGGAGAGPGGPGSAGDDGGVNNPYQAASQANPAQGGPYVGGQGVAPGIGAYPDSTNYPHTLTPPGSPSATPRPADAAPKGPLASSDAPAAAPMKRRAGAPNLGYYQPNSRFIGIDAPNASPQNSMRAGPQATALNLAGLFGGRGQPGVNPNAPGAAAQPVSASAPAGQSNAPANYGPLQQGNSIWDFLSKAPWSYGPLQQGNIWQGSGGPGR